LIICIDVGNTNLTIGAYENGACVKSWRINSNDFSYDKLLLSFDDNKISNIQGICVGSVVSNITDILQELKNKYSDIPVVFYNEVEDIIMDISRVNAKEVGADIVLNGIGGIKKYNDNLLIIDFGTATTFDVFTKNNVFCGTSIAPGVNLSLETLVAKASALPDIKIEPTSKVICGNTVECMQSGIFWGYLNMINGMINQIESEFDFEFTVIATGGLAQSYSKYTKKISHVEKNLALDGLYILFERNKKI